MFDLSDLTFSWENFVLSVLFITETSCPVMFWETCLALWALSQANIQLIQLSWQLDKYQLIPSGILCWQSYSFSVWSSVMITFVTFLYSLDLIGVNGSNFCVISPALFMNIQNHLPLHWAAPSSNKGLCSDLLVLSTGTFSAHPLIF